MYKYIYIYIYIYSIKYSNLKLIIFKQIYLAPTNGTLTGTTTLSGYGSNGNKMGACTGVSLSDTI